MRGLAVVELIEKRTGRFRQVAVGFAIGIGADNADLPIPPRFISVNTRTRYSARSSVWIGSITRTLNAVGSPNFKSTSSSIFRHGIDPRQRLSSGRTGQYFSRNARPAEYRRPLRKAVLALGVDLPANPSIVHCIFRNRGSGQKFQHRGRKIRRVADVTAQCRAIVVRSASVMTGLPSRSASQPEVPFSVTTNAACLRNMNCESNELTRTTFGRRET